MIRLPKLKEKKLQKDAHAVLFSSFLSLLVSQFRHVLVSDFVVCKTYLTWDRLRLEVFQKCTAAEYNNHSQVVYFQNIYLFKVKTLWEGHKIAKNYPLVLAKQLFLLSSVETRGLFFKFLWTSQKSWTLYIFYHFFRVCLGNNPLKIFWEWH